MANGINEAVKTEYSRIECEECHGHGWIQSNDGSDGLAVSLDRDIKKCDSCGFNKDDETAVMRFTGYAEHHLRQGIETCECGCGQSFMGFGLRFENLERNF